MTQDQNNQQGGQLLGRDALMKTDHFKREAVTLDDDTGNFVYVRQMSGRERDALEQSMFQVTIDQNGNEQREQKMQDFRAKIAVRTVCDADGKNQLTEEDTNYISTHWSADKLERIAEVAQRLNNIGKKDREELEKNSAAAQTGNSTSSSA